MVGMSAGMDAVLFDLGKVLLDWDPRYYYRRFFPAEDALEQKMANWGIHVQSVEIRDVIIPAALEDAMSRQAQAERERQAVHGAQPGVREADARDHARHHRPHLIRQLHLHRFQIRHHFLRKLGESALRHRLCVLRLVDDAPHSTPRPKAPDARIFSTF